MSTDNRHPTTTIDSTQRHLFSVTFDGKTKNQLSPPKGISFDPLVPSFKWSLFDNIANNTVGVNGFYESFFSPKSGYYILSYTGPDIPFSRLLKVNSDWIHEIENNDNIRHSILNYDLPLQKYFTIKNDNGDDMNAKIIVPPGFSENAGIRYPVLMRVYGGPGSQIVEQKYNIDYMNAIADAGFVALFVDGRGTGFKGRSYRSCVSKKLGFYETQDQVYFF